MGYQIDFLPVGEGERGGDAITFRYGNLHGDRREQVVVVIDGGTKDSGEELVKHIKQYYGTQRVDLVISTHPDSDHISGLTVVLEKMVVDRLWMHRPWEHAQEIKDLFQSSRITDKSLRENLKKSLESAYELEAIAKEKGIRVYEPFSDYAKASDAIVILGPSKEFYESLLPHFRETPEPKEALGILEKVIVRAKEGISWIKEEWGVETLVDPEENATSPENNSSLICLLQIDGKKKLFTGDAGIEALSAAILKAEEMGIDLKTANFVQMPHHGSKHNIGPSLLDLMLGPKLPEESKLKTVFVGAPEKGDPKHPSRKVANAFKRRGARVIATRESTKCHPSSDAPNRNWVTAEPLPFYDSVED